MPFTTCSGTTRQYEHDMFGLKSNVSPTANFIVDVSSGQKGAAPLHILKIFYLVPQIVVIIFNAIFFCQQNFLKILYYFLYLVQVL